MNPFKNLSAAALQWARSTHAKRQMVNAEHERLGDLLLRTQGLRWKSDFLEKGTGVHPQQGEQIVDWVFYDARAKKELHRALSAKGGAFGSAFWDAYLRRSENAVLGFSDAYSDLLKHVSSTLPEQGFIVDWRCGTGTLASSLLVAAPNRLITAVDPNPRAVVATRRVAKAFFPERSPLMVKAGDPTQPEFRLHPAGGAVLFNSLFLLDTESKALMLEKIHERLDNDGLLLLIEPKPSLQKQSALRLWVQRIVKSACFNDSPVTEFDVALFTEYQKRVLGNKEFQLLAPSEIVALATAAGFSVVLVRDALYGQYTAITLKKLPKPKVSFEPVIRYHDDP